MKFYNLGMLWYHKIDDYVNKLNQQMWFYIFCFSLAQDLFKNTEVYVFFQKYYFLFHGIYSLMQILIDKLRPQI